MENNIVLFTSADEFNLIVPNVVKGTSLDKINTHCINANNKHILPFIDESLFASSDENVISFLKNIQANYAAYEMMQVANMIITKDGAMSIEGSNLKPNFGDKQDVLAYYSETGDTYIDLLLNYLQINLVETSKRFSSVFFDSLSEFETYRLIGSSYRTFFALMPFINSVEKLIIIPRLGDKLNDILTLSEHKDLLYSIKGLIASRVVLKAISSLKLKYDNGVTLTTFIPSIKSKFIEEERSRTEKSIQEDIEMFGSDLEQKLRVLFSSTSTKFENVQTNKGLFF